MGDILKASSQDGLKKKMNEVWLALTSLDVIEAKLLLEQVRGARSHHTPYSVYDRSEEKSDEDIFFKKEFERAENAGESDFFLVTCVTVYQLICWLRKRVYQWSMNGCKADGAVASNASKCFRKEEDDEN